jgi:hypothetical protein
MKFWELLSAFRDEKPVLEIVFNDPRWKQYKGSYENMEGIVAVQNRAVLDEEISYELAKEVCLKSSKKFWFYPSRTPQVLSSFRWEIDQPVEILSAADILDRFGGSMIEEVCEKAYAEFARQHP